MQLTPVPRPLTGLSIPQVLLVHVVLLSYHFCSLTLGIIQQQTPLLI